MSAPETDHELLTEHFTYPPVALIDDIINTVNILADRALDSAERLLLSIPHQKLGFATAEAARQEIESGTHQLETLVNASIDKNFDLFELYTVRNILAVPPRDGPFVRLAHYQGLEFGDSSSSGNGGGEDGDGDGRPSLESVTALRRRLRASQKLNAALELEKARNEGLLRSMYALLGETRPSSAEDSDSENHPEKQRQQSQEDENSPERIKKEDAIFAHLVKTTPLTDGGSESPITTTAEFALSQLPALRTLSSKLQLLIPNLGKESENDDDDDGEDEEKDGNIPPPQNQQASWRSQRTEYVETSSRKCVERMGGHHDDDDDDEEGLAQIGPRLAAEDVETLESIASALARGNEEDGKNEEQEGGEDGADADIMDTS
ncbi:hypothetical protein CP532_1329 [Ophiocordyceps camponoti-leonardi (nom. inval.)]|nr:hypothetical protein CP532_1329 [Ophiocordyceps camponoti-leonardi (nom. inval.)]